MWCPGEALKELIGQIWGGRDHLGECVWMCAVCYRWGEVRKWGFWGMEIERTKDREQKTKKHQMKTKHWRRDALKKITAWLENKMAEWTYWMMSVNSHLIEMSDRWNRVNDLKKRWTTQNTDLELKHTNIPARNVLVLIAYPRVCAWSMMEFCSLSSNLWLLPYFDWISYRPQIDSQHFKYPQWAVKHQRVAQNSYLLKCCVSG